MHGFEQSHGEALDAVRRQDDEIQGAEDAGNVAACTGEDDVRAQTGGVGDHFEVLAARPVADDKETGVGPHVGDPPCGAEETGVVLFRTQCRHDPDGGSIRGHAEFGQHAAIVGGVVQ